PPRSTPFPYTTLFRSRADKRRRLYVRPLPALPPGPAGSRRPRRAPPWPAPDFQRLERTVPSADTRVRARAARDHSFPVIAEPWRSEEHTSELQSPYDL